MPNSTPFTTAALDIIQKQYTGTNIHGLILGKAGLWDRYYGNLSERFQNEIVNIDTCIPQALDNFWGQRLKISRNFTAEDGTPITLSDEDFRKIIKIRTFATTWDGCVPTINLFLKNLFADRGNVHVYDGQNMTFQIVAFFPLLPWESWVFNNYDIFPHPAGVLIQVIKSDPYKYFGFNYEPFKPFNVAPMKSRKG